MKLINPRGAFTASLFINILLFVAVVVLAALLLVPRAQTQTQNNAPTLNIDEQALLNDAYRFGVSNDYLMRVLPGYLIYSLDGTYVYEPYRDDVPLHDYDWNNLYYDKGRTCYAQPVSGDALSISYGVDVSEYQGEIDWPAVAADGISFAMIRLGYRGSTQGSLQEDAFVAANLAGASTAGLQLGAYFYSQAVTTAEAVEEANFALSLCDGYNIDYPIVFDMEEGEGRTANLTNAERTEIALAFCNTVRKAGYQPMIYGNLRWLAGQLDSPALTEYPLWFAQYYDRPLFPYEFAMWQYTSSGTVAGVATSFDLNICFYSWD